METNHTKPTRRIPLAWAFLFGLAILVLQPAGLEAQCVDYGEHLHISGLLEFPNYVEDVVSGGVIACVIVHNLPSYEHLYIIDISNPDDPVVTSGPIVMDLRMLELDGNLLFALGTRALSILDLSNPYSPELLSSVSLPGEGFDLAISDGHVFVADGSAGLQVVDVSDVANPFIAGSNTFRGNLECGVIVGAMAYLWGPSSGLNIFDISNPAIPWFRSSVASLYEVNDVDVRDNFLVFATRGGLYTPTLQKIPDQAACSNPRMIRS